MIAIPSSSTARMKVSRNWPSGIIGRIVRSRRTAPASAAHRRGAATGPSATPAGLRRTGRRGSNGDGRRRSVSCGAQRLPTIAPAEHAGDGHRLRLERTRRERGELQLRRAPLPERVAQPTAQDFVHERLLEKPDLRLGRVHVDVDAIRRDLDEQVDLGAALLDRRDAVRLGDRVRDGPVLHDPAVDEDVLRAAHRPLVAERRDVAVDLQAAGFLADLDEVRPLAEQLKEALARDPRPAGTRAVCVRARSESALVSAKPTVG